MKADKINYHYQEDLVHNLCEIQSDAKMRDFLSALLTPNELEEIGKRLQIFKRLLRGEPQAKIAAHLKAGVATVAHGARELREKGHKVEKMLKR